MKIRDHEKMLVDLVRIEGYLPWPNGYILPLKRFNQEKGQLELGTILKSQPLLIVIEGGTVLTYESARAIIEDGWYVD